MGMWWGDENIVSKLRRRLDLDLYLAMPKETKKTNKGDRDESARTCLGRILASLLVLSRLHEEAHGFRRRRRGRGVRARRRASSVPGGRVKPGRIRHASAPVRVEGVLRGSATPEGAAVGRAARVRQDVASAAAAPGAGLWRRLGRVTHQAHPRSFLLASSRVMARQDGMAVSGQLRDGADGARPLPRRRYGRRGINPHASVHAVPGWEPHRWRAGVGGRDKGRPDKGARLRQQRLRGKNNILRGERWMV